MPVMEIKILPLGTPTASVSTDIANAAKVLQREKEIKYKITSMGTIVEGASVKKLLAVAEKMHKEVLEGNVNRIVTFIELDDRKDKKLTIKAKEKSLKVKLQKG